MGPTVSTLWQILLGTMMVVCIPLVILLAISFIGYLGSLGTIVKQRALKSTYEAERYRLESNYVLDSIENSRGDTIKAVK
jgi:hypothetical protein